ncbi:MAG: hypothetical protein V9H69_21085 [Anaerolineae bacterium]
MTEPLSTIIGAKILDQLLGKAVGKTLDTVLAARPRRSRTPGLSWTRRPPSARCA